MSSEAILTLGKALAWFCIPLGLACWELWRLNRERDAGVDASDWFTGPSPEEEPPAGADR
jgi:hypothetical protein